MMAALALIPLRWWIIGAVILAVSIGFTYVMHGAYESGSQSAVSKIDKANKANEDAADIQSATIERCYTGGGHWDRVNRVCKSGLGE